jgi:hypothetical protein
MKYLFTLLALSIALAAQSPAPAPVPSIAHYGHSSTGAVLPDHAVTPGYTNPAVTQSTIKSTICKHGWTGTVRPPVSYTNKVKTEVMAAYHSPGTDKDYELDHYLPLEIGGNPTDVRNLWPQPYPQAKEKDKIENYLKKQVCTGQMTLLEAQAALPNWYTMYTKVTGKKFQK